MAYPNTKAMICNEGEDSCIYDRKYKLFDNSDILTMIGVYILDGFSPSPWLIQKIQPKSKEPTTSLLTASILGTTNCTIPSVTSLLAKILWQHHHQRKTFPISKLMSSSAGYSMCGRRHGFLAKFSQLMSRHAKCRVRVSSKLKFKRLGDDIQSNFVADDGCTHDFYFCNEQETPCQWILSHEPQPHPHVLEMERFRSLVQDG